MVSLWPAGYSSLNDYNLTPPYLIWKLSLRDSFAECAVILHLSLVIGFSMGYVTMGNHLMYSLVYCSLWDLRHILNGSI